MPIPLHLTGDGEVEAFEEVAIEVNLTKGNGSVVAEIAHFSWAYYARYFEARLEGVESGYLVGERFTASASIGLKDPPPFSGRLPREEQTLHLNGDFLAWGSIAPARIPNAPPRTLVAVGSRFVAPGTFTCEARGPAGVLYEAVLRYVFQEPAPSPSLLERVLGDAPQRPRGWVSSYGIKLEAETECREAGDPQPTPASTPTPTGLDVRATPTPPSAIEDQPPVAVREAPGPAPKPRPWQPTLHVLPIEAKFVREAQTTEYRAEYFTSLTPGGLPGGVSYTWDGWNCGTPLPSVEGDSSGNDGTIQLDWHHPHPPCDPTEDHSHITITLVVEDLLTKATCAYPGAASGTGPDCTTEPTTLGRALGGVRQE